MTNAKSSLRSAVAVILSLLMALVLVMIPQDASAASISKRSVTLTKGYATTLRVSGTSSKVTWTTSKKSVATVSSKGKVTAKGVGTATITAKVGSSKLTCKVTVIGCKLTASSTKVNLNAGDSKLVTITCKGDKNVKATSTNTGVATAKWAQSSFDNNKANLRITAKSAGSATIKVYNKKYTNQYVKISVSVSGSGSSLSTSVSSVTVAENGSSSFTLTADNGGYVNFDVSDDSVFSYSEGNWSNNKSTITIRGKKAGSSVLTITDADNPGSSVKVNITVNGSSGGYYGVYDDQDSSRFLTNNDRYVDFYDRSKGRYRYVLVPGNNYDKAQYNTAVAKATNDYQDYVVYSERPNTTSSGSTVQQFTCSINDVTASGGIQQTASKTVTRYVRVPSNYDTAEYEYAKAAYIGSYEYGVLYTKNPLNDASFQRKAYDDKYKQYTTYKNGASVTRYLVYPSYVSDPDSYYSSALSKYGIGAGGVYYQVFEDYNIANSAKVTSNDQIIPFSANGRSYYLLAPSSSASNYDQVEIDTAKAAYTGYTYGVVYSKSPSVAGSDYSINWTKSTTVYQNNGYVTKTVTHYVKYPSNSYENQNEANKIKAKDLGQTYYEPYTVLWEYPSSTPAGYRLVTWFSNGSSTNRYAFVPANNPDILRLNDLILGNGGQARYYGIYSTVPNSTQYQSSGDYVYSGITSNGKVVYVLLPDALNYDQNTLQLALNLNYNVY